MHVHYAYTSTCVLEYACVYVHVYICLCGYVFVCVYLYVVHVSVYLFHQFYPANCVLSAMYKGEVYISTSLPASTVVCYQLCVTSNVQREGLY